MPSRAQAPDVSAQQALEKIPPPSGALTIRLPQPVRYRLPNGMLLLVLENHKLPTVSMILRVRAGSFYEPANRQGVAAMTAAMLEEGTKTRTSEQIAAMVDDMGASLDASAEQGGDMATVSASGLTENSGPLLTLLADIVRNPTFPAGQFTKVKEQTVADLLQEAQDPEVLASVAAARALYGSTPPAQVMPLLTQVRALTPRDLSAFHDAFYRPERAVLGVAGDVNAEMVHRTVLKAFGSWKRGTRPLEVKLPAYKPLPGRVYVVDRPGSVQTEIRLVGLGIPRTSGDYPALDIMNQILGGNATSRLWMNIRETKGYAYDVGSGFEAPRYTGYWYAGGPVRNAVTADALKEFFQELRRIQEQPVSRDELDGARQRIVGRFARDLESPASILGYTLDIVEFGLPADYWQKFPARVRAVTAEDIQRVARKYLGTGHVQVIVVGQRQDIVKAVQGYGPQVTLDPARMVQ